MERYLTHKDVEHLCDDFMAAHGWERVRFSLISTAPRTLVDRIYAKEGDLLGFEIKPENILDEEVKNGIGQLACLVPYQIKPYLVISESKFEVFEYIIDEFPWLGVLTYFPFSQNVGELVNRKKPVLNLKGIVITPPVGPPKPLTPEFIQAALDELQIHGTHSVNILVKMLRRHYPNYRYSSRYMGTLLTQMGFEKKSGGYIVPEKQNFAGGGTSLVTVPTSSTVPTPPSNDGMWEKSKKCPQCGATMKIKWLGKKRGQKGRGYYICSDTNCEFISQLRSSNVK